MTKSRSDLPAGRVLMVTKSPDGEQFGLDTGQPVTARKAAELQRDLFTKPSEDGLFPGFSASGLGL